MVLITIPAAIVVDAWFTTLPGTRPACRSAASASASALPVTWGMEIRCGPADTMRVTVPPLLTCEPMAGLVLITLPLATALLNCGAPIFAVRPSLRTSSRAVAAARPRTAGTVVYWPAVCHQTTSPITSAASTPAST